MPRWMLVATLFACFGLTACVVPPPDVAAPTPTVTVTAPPETQPFGGDLVPLVVARPATASNPPAGTPPDGPLDIVGSARIYNPQQVDQVVAYLRGFGYDRGAYGAWRDESGALVAIELLAFASIDGALDWQTATQRAYEQAPGEIRSAVFERVDYGRWFEFPGDGGQSRLTAVFRHGSIGVQIHVQAPTANVDLLTRLAEQQASRLPPTTR